MAALVQGMPVVIEEKHPWSIKRIPIDWTAFAGGATISQSEWVDAMPDAGITLSGAQVDGLLTSALVSGGTVGQTAYVENRVTFSDGRKDVITVIMPIASKVRQA